MVGERERGKGQKRERERKGGKEGGREREKERGGRRLHLPIPSTGS